MGALTFHIGIPLLAVVGVAVAIARSMVYRVPRTLPEVIPLIQGVDLRDLGNLVDPALDTYLNTFLPTTSSLTPEDTRTAQKNRIVFTRQHFKRLLHNTILFRQIARTEYGRNDRLSTQHRIDRDHTVCEILILARNLRRDMLVAQVKLLLMQLSGCYSYYRLVDGNFIMQQYCRLTERVLVLSRRYGHCYYDNLLAALCYSVPDPEFAD